MQQTSTQTGGLQLVCPLQDVTSKKAEIIKYLDFGFYEHVSCKENARLGVKSIGRWLGFSQRVGGIITYWILTQKGKVISQKTVQIISNLGKHTYEGRAIINEFDS